MAPEALREDAGLLDGRGALEVLVPPTAGRIGNRQAQRVFAGSCSGSPATSATPKIDCQTDA